ncbi:ATP-grasp domain-containing protein [Nonomuraea sp. NPDC050328]|uniref:ATP-grasp domain-containing protein n=1 Tax=Nonomuraea sp. NPDC050328 TaxID=3364361 RepID=UPI003787A395
MDVAVHAVLAAPHGPVAQSRYLASRTLWASAPTPEESFLATLRSTAKRMGRPAVLLPMDDITAIYIARHSAILTPDFLVSAPAADVPARVADKHTLAATCAEHGIPHPEIRVIENAADVSAAPFGYPLMAKWARPWLSTGEHGFRSTMVVRTPADLAAVADLAALEPGELLLQRHLAPRPDADWFFHGYFRDGSCVFSGTGRKERAYPPTAGITTLGRWLPNPEIDETARTLAKALGYSGVLDLDFRYDPRDGRHYLLDFNPRVGAQFRLFGDTGGMDVIRAAYLDLAGEPLDVGAPHYDRTYLVENYDLLRKLMRARGTNSGKGRGWLASLRQADELAWYASDDFEPFVGMVKHTFLRALKGRRKQPPRRPHD